MERSVRFHALPALWQFLPGNVGQTGLFSMRAHLQVISLIVVFAIQKADASVQARVVPGIFIAHVQVRLDKHLPSFFEAIVDLEMPSAGHLILQVMPLRH